MAMTVAERLTAAWYSPRLTPLTLALAPLTPVFVAASALRRTLYRTGVLAKQRLPVPVVVVGNLSVGGSGKTPLVAALAHELVARGWHPASSAALWPARRAGRRCSTAGHA
jgi:tetraacyldisaccharide 4'-kinase